MGACLLGAFGSDTARANSCYAATSQGTAPSDYQDYCWLDFTGYSDATAQSAGGQAFSYNLPDGSTLSLVLKVTTNGASPVLAAVSAPSWSGAAIGNEGFIGISGHPVLYESQTGSTVTATLSSIRITPPAGSTATATYAIVGADGESTNGGETLSFTTNGSAWTTLASIANGTAFPTLSGTNTTTVTETGVGGTVGAYAFSSLGNPTTVSTTMVGSGLQGAMFALRYASVSVTAQLSGARANTSDQFTYGLYTTSGGLISSLTSSGTSTGPFTPDGLPLIAATYSFAVTESMATGSTSTLANYAPSLTCTNKNTGSATAMPTAVAASTYTFPPLSYGDSITCVFTDTAYRANLAVAKTGTTTVAGGGAVTYSIAVTNGGPSAANGAVVTDPAVANFTATGLSCGAATGGAVCPAAAALTVASLQGSGISLPTLPSGGGLTLTVTGTAGAGNISNTAAIAPPSTVVNSNATPTSTATTTVTAGADLATVLSFPSAVTGGKTVTGTLTWTNNGPSTATGVYYDLQFSPGVTPTLTGLPTGVTYSYNATSGVVTFTGLTTSLASGASVGPITITYTQLASASSDVGASIGATTTDPNSANNASVLVIANTADLAASLTFPSSVNAGSTASGTATFTNNGPITATGVAFTLTLPANLAVAPSLSGLPTGATYSYAASTGVVTLTGMPTTLAAAASVGPITISYVQPATASSTLTSSISGTTVDPNTANNTATATIGGSAEADLSTALSFPSNVNAGSSVSGTVSFANAGPSTASGVSYTLNLAANLTAVALTGLPTGASYSYTASTGVVALSGLPTTLASGASVGPITVSYTQPGAATSTVTTGVTATTADPNTANNSATATIGGTAEADLASVLSFPSSVNAGSPVSGTATFTNAGPSTASGVTFTLTLAANLATMPVLSGLPTGATYTYSASTGVVTLTGMPTSLAAAASVGPITISYVQPGAATSTVNATVSATTNDPNTANNSASVTVTGSAVADVAAAVSFPGTVNAGQTVSGSLTYTNSGTQHGERIEHQLDAARESRGHAHLEWPADRCDLYLHRQHRRRELERNADDPRLRWKYRTDRGQLRSTGYRDLDRRHHDFGGDDPIPFRATTARVRRSPAPQKPISRRA